LTAPRWPSRESTALPEMGVLDRLLYFLLAVLVASIPFELRSPAISNLQWLFLAVSLAALPILIRHRKELLRDRLVLAALLFVITQWLAALLAAEFNLNAIKAAIRVTAGLVLLSVTLCVGNRRSLLKVWSVAAVLAALYGILDYNGFGTPSLFRATDFLVGADVRLSGSFEYPNTAAAFFALSLPIVWTTIKPAWLRVFGSFLISVALVMTYSRGAMIALLLMLVVWLLVAKARDAVYLGVLLIATLGALMISRTSLFQRFYDAQPVKVLSAEYEPEFNMMRGRPDELNEMNVQVKNSGTTPWLPSKDHPFTLSYWWSDPTRKRPFRADTIYTPIPVPLHPQQSVIIHASFRTPAEPGLYLLTWDVSQSGSNWFSGMGVFPGLVEALIQPGIERWSGHGDVSGWYRPEISSLFVANVPFSRSELWRAALDMAHRHPILGSGPDNFRLLYGRQFNISSWDTKVRSNSLYLELLSGSGLAGLAAFGLMMAMVPRRAAVTAPAVALGIFLIHGLVDDFLMTTPIYFAFWILLAQTRESTRGLTYTAHRLP
jgi:O-antigen ligase